MNKSVHIVTNIKGGVGKSILSKALSHAFRNLNPEMNTIIADFDIGNSTLAKTYGRKDENGRLLPNDEQGLFEGVLSFDMNSQGDRDQFLNLALESGDTGALLLDLQGGTLDRICEKFDDMGNGPQAMAEFYDRAGFDLVFHIPITSDHESILTIQRIGEMFRGTKAKFVVWRNLRDDIKSFVMFDDRNNDCRPLFDTGAVDANGRPALQYAIRYCLDNGMLVKDMPRMEGAYAAKLNRLRMPFPDALAHREHIERKGREDFYCEAAERHGIQRWCMTMMKTLDDALVELKIKRERERISSETIRASVPAHLENI